MKTRWCRALSLVLIVFLSTPPPSVQAAKAKKKSKAKEPPPPVEQPVAVWPSAELTVGFQSRSSETEGIGDLLVPVWNPGGKGLLFVNPRTAVTDHDAEEFNVGIGYRHLLDKYNVILGANAYYDYRDTGYAHYDQWGIGLEILSPWIDARANYYDPEDKKIVVASETETTTRQSVRTSEDWQDPYAAGHAILQDYVLTRTLLTETFSRTYEQYQQPLGGYDWEVGVRLPLPTKPEQLEARVFGGYYDFDRDYGPDAEGWKARAEVRLYSSLFLDAGVYENDELTGSDWFAGARVSVPLDLAAVSQGRNPFAAARSRWNAEPRDLSARLTEMVMRDPQIRLETSKFLENKALASDTSSTRRSSQRSTVTLMDDIQFVNGDVPASGNGTAERPMATIQEGADSVFGQQNVYVFNASQPYNENVVLQDGTTLWGSGSLIPANGGRSFGSGVRPVIDGVSMGPAVTMANQTTIRGFSIRNTDRGGPNQMVILPNMPTMDISRIGIFGPDVTDLTIRDNLIAGNTDGAILARNGDFNLNFDRNQVRNNEVNGLWVEGVGSSGTFVASIRNSQFTDNTAVGALIATRAYDESLIQLQDSAFSRNGDWGARVFQDNSGLAMTVAGGLQAHHNQVGGFSVSQQFNDLALANISGSSATYNQGEAGFRLVQWSSDISIGLFGAPSVLSDAAAALEDAGLPLPPEVALFLASSGPVTASHNAFFGINSQITADNGLALGGYFDVTANQNTAGGGVTAMHMAPNGVAAGLAGSTANWGEMLQLAGNVLDAALGLQLPLDLTGTGTMQVNDNGGWGFRMQTQGDIAGLNAIVGMETLDNDDFGTASLTYSPDIAINAVARLVSTDNTGAGLLMDMVGQNTGAIGLIADVNASDNGDSGITASVDSPNGFAAFASLSTDALRPAAALLGEEFLGAPVTVPGLPFGPVTTSGNVGDGFNVTVTGRNGPYGIGALALFLDTRSDNNDTGFDVTVEASEASAIAAFVSSDLAYGLVSDLIGEPLPDAGLGDLTADFNWNNGIDLAVTGYDSAVALLAGVNANNNFGGGINASLTSTDGNSGLLGGGAMAFLVDVDANFNVTGDGIALDLATTDQGNITAGLVDIHADMNGLRGLELTANSLNGSAIALLSDVNVQQNGAVGIFADLTAAEDAGLAITDSDSVGNTGRGLNAQLNAGEDAYFFAGDFAAEDLDGVFNFGAEIGPLVDLIPTGPVDFSSNGNGGLFVDAVSTGGDVILGLNGATANNNGNMGFNLNLTAANGNILGDVLWTTATNNGGHGLTLDLAGGGGNSGVRLTRVATTDNGGNGLNILENYTGNAFVGGELLTSINNAANGVRIVSDGAGLLELDFGGGGTSGGFSSFFGNGNRDFRYNDGTLITVDAQNNWWGVAPPAAGQFAGDIDWTNWLLAAP